MEWECFLEFLSLFDSVETVLISEAAEVDHTLQNLSICRFFPVQAGVPFRRGLSFDVTVYNSGMLHPLPAPSEFQPKLAPIGQPNLAVWSKKGPIVADPTTK